MYKVDRVATGQADIADARCVALLHAIRAGIAFVSAAGELRDVMSGVLAAAGLATLADKAFAIRFKRDEQGQFQPATHAQWQAPGTPAGSIAWEAFSPAVAESLARSSALVVTAGDGREAGVALLGTGLRTMALALVTQAGEPWGAVGIASAKAGRVWTALDLLALETFVELFSSALLRSRYMQRLKAREKERALIVGFSRLRLEDGQHPDAAFQWLAESLADTGSQAAASVARIVIDGNELRSANFRVLPVTHASAIVIDGKGRGTIEIMQSSEAAAADLAGEPEEAQLFLDELGRQVALVLERLDAERKLALDNAILAAEREASPDGIVVADNEGRIISHNRRLLELCGIGQEMAMPAVESQFFACFAAQLVDGASVAARMRPLQANPDAAAHETFDLKDGRIFDLHAAPMKARDGTPLGRAWFFRDITELRHHQAEISRVTHTDPLTGQPNRGLFVEDLSLAFDALERGGNPFAVHYLDIDRFKDVNDAFGHRNGDLLLKAVARRLRGELRETDILARLGGDEFAILQPNVTNAEIAGGLATKLIEFDEEAISDRRYRNPSHHQHRHRAVVGRTQLAGRNAGARGPRALPGEGCRPRPVSFPRRVARPSGPRARGALRGFARRARAQGIRASLPAAGRDRDGPDRRRRGARALEPSDARPHLAGRLHSDRRTIGPDPSRWETGSSTKPPGRCANGSKPDGRRP